MESFSGGAGLLRSDLCEQATPAKTGTTNPHFKSLAVEDEGNFVSASSSYLARTHNADCARL